MIWAGVVSEIDLIFHQLIIIGQDALLSGTNENEKKNENDIN